MGGGDDSEAEERDESLPTSDGAGGEQVRPGDEFQHCSTFKRPRGHFRSLSWRT